MEPVTVYYFDGSKSPPVRTDSAVHDASQPSFADSIPHRQFELVELSSGLSEPLFSLNWTRACARFDRELRLQTYTPQLAKHSVIEQALAGADCGHSVSITFKSYVFVIRKYRHLYCPVAIYYILPRDHHPIQHVCCDTNYTSAKFNKCKCKCYTDTWR